MSDEFVAAPGLDLTQLETDVDKYGKLFEQMGGVTDVLTKAYDRLGITSQAVKVNFELMDTEGRKIVSTMQNTQEGFLTTATAIKMASVQLEGLGREINNSADAQLVLANRLDLIKNTAREAYLEPIRSAQQYNEELRIQKELASQLLVNRQAVSGIGGERGNGTVSPNLVTVEEDPAKYADRQSAILGDLLAKERAETEELIRRNGVLAQQAQEYKDLEQTAKEIDKIMSSGQNLQAKIQRENEVVDQQIAELKERNRIENENLQIKNRALELAKNANEFEAASVRQRLRQNAFSISPTNTANASLSEINAVTSAIGKVENLIAQGLVSAQRAQDIIFSIQQRTGSVFVGAEQQLANHYIAIEKNVENLGKEFRNAENAQARLNDSSGAFDKTWRRIGEYAAGQLVSQSLYTLRASLQSSTDEAIKFEEKISEIRTISQSNQLSFDAWAGSVENLSNKFGSPIVDVANAAYQTLSSQVASGAESFNFMGQALQFSQITMSSAEDSVKLLSAGLRSFGLEASETERVSSALFGTITQGRIRAEELANVFGRVGGLAHATGLSIEETGAALATITNSGVPANEAMTLLNNVLTHLLNPTKDLKDLFATWGVANGEAAISTFGFIGVLAKLQEATHGSSAEIIDFFKDIRGTRGAIDFANEGLINYQKNLAAISDTKKLDVAAQITLENPGRQFEIQLNEIKNFVLHDFGEIVLNEMQALTSSTNEFGKVTNNLVTYIKELIPVVVGAAGAYSLYKVVTGETVDSVLKSVAALTAQKTAKTENIVLTEQEVLAQRSQLQITLDNVAARYQANLQESQDARQIATNDASRIASYEEKLAQTGAYIRVLEEELAVNAQLMEQTLSARSLDAAALVSQSENAVALEAKIAALRGSQVANIAAAEADSINTVATTENTVSLITQANAALEARTGILLYSAANAAAATTVAELAAAAGASAAGFLLNPIVLATAAIGVLTYAWFNYEEGQRELAQSLKTLQADSMAQATEQLKLQVDEENKVLAQRIQTIKEIESTQLQSDAKLRVALQDDIKATSDAYKDLGESVKIQFQGIESTIKSGIAEIKRQATEAEEVGKTARARLSEDQEGLSKQTFELGLAKLPGPDQVAARIAEFKRLQKLMVDSLTSDQGDLKINQTVGLKASAEATQQLTELAKQVKIAEDRKSKLDEEIQTQQEKINKSAITDAQKDLIAQTRATQEQLTAARRAGQNPQVENLRIQQEAQRAALVKTNQGNELAAEQQKLDKLQEERDKNQGIIDAAAKIGDLQKLATDQVKLRIQALQAEADLSAKIAAQKLAEAKAQEASLAIIKANVEIIEKAKAPTKEIKTQQEADEYIKTNYDEPLAALKGQLSVEMYTKFEEEKALATRRIREQIYLEEQKRRDEDYSKAADQFRKSLTDQNSAFQAAQKALQATQAEIKTLSGTTTSADSVIDSADGGLTGDLGKSKVAYAVDGLGNLENAGKALLKFNSDLGSGVAIHSQKNKDGTESDSLMRDISEIEKYLKSDENSKVIIADLQKSVTDLVAQRNDFNLQSQQKNALDSMVAAHPELNLDALPKAVVSNTDQAKILGDQMIKLSQESQHLRQTLASPKPTQVDSTGYNPPTMDQIQAQVNIAHPELNPSNLVNPPPINPKPVNPPLIPKPLPSNIPINPDYQNYSSDVRDKLSQFAQPQASNVSNTNVGNKTINYSPNVTITMTGTPNDADKIRQVVNESLRRSQFIIPQSAWGSSDR